MYLATLIPALLMATLYLSYIIIRCRLNPELAPPAPPEKRTGWRIKIASLRAVSLPLLLVFVIMGGIYGGVMSPLEASAVGAIGSLVVAAVYRRLTWKVVKESLHGTIKISGMLAFLFIGIGCFTSVYEGIGAPELATKIAYAMPGGGWGMIAVMQVALLGFGSIMDDIAIILIFGPIFVFVIKTLGFNTLWYGVVFLINMNIAFLTPPYGFALFFMKAAAPKEFGITMVDIYRAVIPFIGLAVLALVLVIVFPPLALWLPNLVLGGG